MKNYFLFPLLAILLFVACNSGPQTGNPVVEIETSYGDIELEIFQNEAPKTSAAFLSYVDKGYYKRSHFYRVLSEYNQPSSGFKAELVQGGLYRSNRQLSDSLPGIEHEPTNQTGILHTHGTLSMARTEPGTATTEFFICIGDQHGFDYGGPNNADGQGYAAFGRVVKGFDALLKIYRQKEENQSFTPPVLIFNIKRIK